MASMLEQIHHRLPKAEEAIHQLRDNTGNAIDHVDTKVIGLYGSCTGEPDKELLKSAPSPQLWGCLCVGDFGNPRKTDHRAPRPACQIPNMSHSSALSSYPCPGMNPGGTRVPQGLLEFSGPCLECGKMVLRGQGLFCANYWARCRNWPLCEGIWCANCYCNEEDGMFPVWLPVDVDRTPVVAKKDDDRFLTTHVGNHWMCSFQCDLCHFQNIQNWGPNSNSGVDQLLLWCICRANLDAMWAQETKTVEKTHQELV